MFEQTEYVLLDANRLRRRTKRSTGRGVTMAFLDSGFYAHEIHRTKGQDRRLSQHLFDRMSRSERTEEK